MIMEESWPAWQSDNMTRTFQNFETFTLERPLPAYGDLSSKSLTGADFNEIYLHTQKNLVAGFNFWKKVGFHVTLDTNNDLQTVHMVKNLSGK